MDDALYYAIRPMLAVSGGRLMMLSTPHGRRGVFFEAWDHGTEWKRYRVPATECPRISPEFLEEERWPWAIGGIGRSISASSSTRWTRFSAEKP